MISTPTVLLPGGGGTAAVGALKALRNGGFRGKIVSTDCDPLSAGLYLADSCATLPPISDPSFFDRALEVIEREGVSQIFPTSGFDILVYSQHKEDLKRLGVTVAMSDFSVIMNCVDKWSFYKLTEKRFPLPSTYVEPTQRLNFPCFVKPIRGKGSRGVTICESSAALARLIAANKDLLIQDYLPGEEYSIDVLSDLQGHPLVAVPRVRIATREGISVKGKVVHDAQIEQLCMALAGFLGLKGPSCMQMKRDENECPRFIEVNPRMGGGTIFAALAGVNFPMLLAALAAGDNVSVPPFRELTVLRYYDEVVMQEQIASDRVTSNAIHGL